MTSRGMSLAHALLVFALIVIVGACGSPQGAPSSFAWGDGGVEASPSRADARPPVSLNVPGATIPSGDCPPSAKLIYVTGVNGETDLGSDLYSFDPSIGKFTLIGAMSCLSSPTHMTVDRQGTAWVVADGYIYTASTTDASCTRVPNWHPDPVNFPDFALTFVGTTSATGNVLYVLGDSGLLGAFDVTTGSMTHVGRVPLPATSGDMTTNGDGTLYFLRQDVEQTLNRIDPSTARVLRQWSTGEDSENSQALAYWGGLFFDFIGNRAFTYDVTTGKTTSIGTAPLFVTGAGQSTCVPTDAGAPPNIK
jgi:hypothetical protein